VVLCTPRKPGGRVCAKTVVNRHKSEELEELHTFLGAYKRHAIFMDEIYKFAIASYTDTDNVRNQAVE